MHKRFFSVLYLQTLPEARNLETPSEFFNKPIDPIMIENVAGDCVKSKSSKFPVGRESKSHRQNGPQKVESQVAVV